MSQRGSKNFEKVLFLHIGRRIRSSAFLSLPVARYGIRFAGKWSSNGRHEAVVSKLLAQGLKDMTIRRYSFQIAFFRQMRYFLSLTYQ